MFINRLLGEAGGEKVKKKISKENNDWCFEKKKRDTIQVITQNLK